MTLYLGENVISGTSYPIEPTRNLGQIIESILPLTDAGLHLLDGALIQGSGIYSAFVTKIGELSSLYPSVFVTEADWQTSVNTYGVCGKFVYNANDNTVRLPKITGIIEGTTDLTALGELVEAGLPMSWFSHTHTRGSMNITGGVDYHVWGNGAWGAFYADGKSANKAGAGSDNKCPFTRASFSADRTWSGSTSTPDYTDSSHNNSTVQPQTIKVFYYIVLATNTKTDIEVDIDEVTTDLNDKVDLDGTNATFPHIVETYVNGTSGYNLYSNGYCEQWGFSEAGTQPRAITFTQTYKDTNYIVTFGDSNEGYGVAQSRIVKLYTKSTTGMTCTGIYQNGVNPDYKFYWHTAGYIR